jgi:putative (di)nucleoside polyphosphate hydrolase
MFCLEESWKVLWMNQMGKKKEGLYRKCVGMVVFNSAGKVLVGERVGVQNSWQFPQGGVDDEESLLEASRRELYEEVGIQNAVFVYEHPEWLSYGFPDWLKADWEAAKKVNHYEGQTQKWFLYFWDGKIEDCLLELHEKEFEQIAFIPLEKTIDFIIDFKKEVYKKVIESFSPIIIEYLKR